MLERANVDTGARKKNIPKQTGILWCSEADDGASLLDFKGSSATLDTVFVLSLSFVKVALRRAFFVSRHRLIVAAS